MILAAGRGTRLGALGERVAKALVEIDGRPLLAHQLDYLADEGVELVVVNASHLAGQVTEFVVARTGPPELQVITENEPLGTAGGVINALQEFSREPLLVYYGDVIAREGLQPLVQLHEAHRPVATLTVYETHDAEGKGVVEVDGDRVVAFHEKDPSRGSGWVNAGVYVVEPSWLAEFPRGKELDFGFDLFPNALAAGRELLAYRLAASVLDIGTPADLEKARMHGFSGSS
jgi:mannose-1-phosphate guanylyltransferase